MSKCISGHSQACTSLSLHPFTHFWTIWQSLNITKKGGRNWGQPQASRPPWSVDPRVVPLYLNQCTGSSWNSPCPSSTSFISCSFFLCSLCSCFSPLHKKKKKNISLFCILTSHLHFVFTFFSSQERVCGGSTTPQEWFCGASSPTRMILWSVITHKNNFCQRQPCPARTTNSRVANFYFY